MAAEESVKSPTQTRGNGEAVEVPESITVRELAERLEISPIELIKELMNNGIMANINQTIDFDTAAIVAEDLGFQIQREGMEVPEEEEIVEEEKVPEAPRFRFIEGEDQADLVSRPPVVTVLGHVDHGKTTLLDTIRQTDVVAGESGGITQHIGAYQVSVDSRQVTFIDTPGHEAFTAMRARGAQVTDIVVLVVAADDGVMPQTEEAIDHAQAASVPIIVVLNKMDLPTARPDMVRQQLAEKGLTPDEWGGDTIVIPVSALEQKGIEDLLDAIVLVAEEEDIQGNPDAQAAGTVIEAELDRTRGPVATLLVQNGTLHVSESMVVRHIYGRVRAMFDENGDLVDEASPGMPVRVLGLSDVPQAGDVFEVMEDSEARETAEERAEQIDETVKGPLRPTTLEEMYEKLQASDRKELNVILKADAQGSLEPIVDSLEDLGNADLSVKILRQATGNITESDIMLARASDAIAIGFNVGTDSAARAMAENEAVEIRHYNVIYELIDDVDKALKGLLEPVYREVQIGEAEIRAVFDIPRTGKVAGVYVRDGTVTRDAQAKVRRNGDVIFEGPVSSLRRFKEDVREVSAGYECGVGLQGFEDFQEEDIIEFYKEERVR